MPIRRIRRRSDVALTRASNMHQLDQRIYTLSIRTDYGVDLHVDMTLDDVNALMAEMARVTAAHFHGGYSFSRAFVRELEYWEENE